MGHDKHQRRALLRSLVRDRTANTLAIAAAAMIPLVAMVGGGVDASRYYMTASRMQAACDAGALAARRAMVDDTFTNEHKQLGLDFFDQNFSDGMFGIEGGQRDYTSDGEGVVTGTASGTLPTSIMGVFGYENFQIDVSCTAEINISNTDIMFVLDVTGSMNCAPDNPGGGNCGNTPDPGSKIDALRVAVMSFYDAVDDATAAAAQVRYGVVPYASNVNVGFSIPREFMADRHTYQSRVARFREDITFIPGNGVEVGEELVLSDQWEWLPRNLSNFGSTNIGAYRFRTDWTNPRNNAQNFCWNTLPGTYNVGGDTWEVFSGTLYYTGVWSGGNWNNRGGCAGRVRKTRIATAADVVEEQTIRNVVFDDYVYCPVDTGDATPCNVNNPADSPAGWESVDLSTLYDDNRIDLPTGNQGAMETHVWQGCIEEADTVATGTFSPVPADAFDLNINLVPTNRAQQWKPSLRNVVYLRNDPTWVETTNNFNHPGHDCPTEAFRLRDISRAEMQTFVDSINARGNTYHDIGMIWGARFISPRGIFASDNQSAPNGDAIARHIVFMTDGLLVTSNAGYVPYGMERVDRRVTDDGSGGQANTRHALRFQAACRAARQENITVWVVAFGTTLSQNLIDCASPGRAYSAQDNAALNSAFREIAQKIAALRLTS